MPPGEYPSEGDSEATLVYDVVVNHEEQYSIWPVSRPVPAGWKAAGFRGGKSEALDHIEKVWTDITPLSVRQAAAGPPSQ
ncbi:MbtH family NRPS accessory protein [Streptomyces sp. PT12]|uniref:MbtH family protein n=1 Tax=Streptomyces sp. PT12 TaxID=1510197 RepID=UPI000DE1D241|nr:MbtH family NRPS accessory protein [Streptomyces sp. PT12]RBM11973.1 MbtH family protein [Streptomyces sp. PT12]